MARPRTALGTAGRIATTAQLRDERGRWVTCREAHDHKGKGHRWRARTKYRDLDGVLRDVEVFADNKGRAETKLKVALSERQAPSAGRILRPELAVQDAAALWLEQVERQDSGLAQRSRDQYRGCVRNHVKGSPIAALTLREVNRVSTIEAWLQGIADGTGTGAAKTARTVLANILDMAVRDDVLQVNAARQARPAKAERAETASADSDGESKRQRDTERALTRTERDKVLTVVDAHPAAVAQDVADVVAWLAGTGVRIGEALSQRWEDVNLDHLDDKGNPDPVALVRGTKSETATRLVHLPAWLAERIGARERKGDMVFTSPGDKRKRWQPDPNKPRDSRNVSRILRHVLDAAGFPWATAHTLRRTAITLMDQAGLPIASIAYHAGHSDPSMTMREYLDRRHSTPAAAAVL